MLSLKELTLGADKILENETEGVIDLDSLLSFFRRQWRVLVVSAGVAGTIGLLYVATATQSYTASTTVLIDRPHDRLFDDFSYTSEIIDYEGILLTDIEVLKSDSIAGEVIVKLGLKEDPTFIDSSKSGLSLFRYVPDFRTWLDAVALDPDALRSSAVAQIVDNMDVKRVGPSYVLEISYTSSSPQAAARISNAIAESYLTDKMNSKFEATRRAIEWLQDRIAELRVRVTESDLAVQRFRTENKLLEVTSGDRSMLNSDLQLAQLNTALISAQAETAEAQAKYDRVKAILQSGRTDQIVADVLDSPISNALRKKYLEASRFQSEISARFGLNHLQAIRARKEMEEYRRLLLDELNRLSESNKSDLLIAQTKEQSIKTSLDKAKQASTAASEHQVQLRELERTAEAYRGIYQSLLTRFQDAAQKQSFPITEARIVTPAQVPLGASAPRKPLVLAFSLFLGIAAGAGIGAFREHRDRFFRTGKQVRESLSLEYLGQVPLIAVEALPGGVVGQQQSPRLLDSSNPIARYVVKYPLSDFAETLRSAKLAVDMKDRGKSTKIIGISSSLPGEGKSTLAINFGQLLATQSCRTVLIDADVRNPGATRAIGRHAKEGLIEVILDGTNAMNVLMRDSDTNLAFLPAIVRRHITNSADMLSSKTMVQVLADLSEHFDYIILDLPPLSPVVDARAIFPLLDTSISIVEWGRTSRRLVKETFRNHPMLLEKCSGVILNKVNKQKQTLYQESVSEKNKANNWSNYYMEG